MSDIQQAIDRIRANADLCQRYINYYEGNHELAFASDKFRNTFGNTLKQMRENLCPIVVDAPADRMEIINFSSGEAKETAKKAWEIWQRELMELYSVDLHKEAFKCRDAYLIVWADDIGEAEFIVQDSRQCAVIYDENTGKPLFGAKMWSLEDKRVRLTLYYADRIEKFITAKAIRSGMSLLKESSFIPLAEDGEEQYVKNTYGVIPMFHFKAEPILSNAIPIQDRLNKTICDELVAQEFAAYPQRWAVGLEPPVNEITGNQELPFKAGADRLWFTGDAATKFGEFGTADLTQFIQIEDSARLSVARVTGTPLHFFSFTTSDAMSGEALKTLESRFTKRIRRTCLAHGAVWSEAMRLALNIEGEAVDSSLTAQWESPEQRSESELLDTLGKKKDFLEIPVDTLREEMGYSVEQIAKFNTEMEAKRKELADAMAVNPPKVNNAIPAP